MTSPLPDSTGWAVAQSASVYSIGAVASMLGLPPATLRTWEERYGVVAPKRTPAGHRLYSRDQVEQLRFVMSEIESGRTAADAHRLLARRSLPARQHAARGPRVLILVAERDPYSAELIEFLLRTEGFDVQVALDVAGARADFRSAQPQLSIVEFLIDGGAGEDLCRWLKAQGTAPILVLSSLAAADRALRAGADAFLVKPVGHLQLVSAVKDLLGVSAMLDLPSSHPAGQ
jgi:DNA-binding transcriptional MerR regulator